MSKHNKNIKEIIVELVIMHEVDCIVRYKVLFAKKKNLRTTDLSLTLTVFETF